MFVSRGKGAVSAHPIPIGSTSSCFSGGGKPILPPKFWSPGVCRSAPECGRACWPRLRLRRPPALVRLLAPRLPSSTFRSSRALRVRPTGGQACRRARELRRRWRSAGPVPAPTRGFILAALTLKPNSLPGQPRVTLSLRKEHVKSSLRAMPGGKGGLTPTPTKNRVFSRRWHAHRLARQLRILRWGQCGR